MRSKKPAGKLRLPRAPLPKQTGGAHKLKAKAKPKYQKADLILSVVCHRDCSLPCPDDERCCLYADDWF